MLKLRTIKISTGPLDLFLPQGLKIAPAIFQDQISHDLAGLNRTQAYMDDILSGDEMAQKQLKSLDGLLSRLQEHGYKLKLSKCKFLMKTAVFAGCEVTEHGIAMHLDTI